MTEPDPTKWPLIFQVIAGIGVTAMYLLSFFRPASKSQKLENEVPISIASELKALRGDFEMSLKALRESIEGRFDRFEDRHDDLEERLRENERKTAVVEDRSRRQ